MESGVDKGKLNLCSLQYCDHETPYCLEKNRSTFVYLSHATFRNKRGAWAVIPILDEIYRKLIHKHTKWFVLLEPSSTVNLGQLLHCLSKEDHRKLQYLGHELYDSEPTIIHHFKFFGNPSQFKYPLIKAGVVFTVPLLRSLAKRLPNVTLSSDFFIDASHELALFIWNKSNGVKLRAVPYLCEKKKKSCAIYATDFPQCVQEGERPLVAVEQIMFAVKTYEKFHSERLSVVLNTWGKLVHHMRIFSNVRNESIPTIATGVTNTGHGHCEKTIKILRLIEDELNHGGGGGDDDSTDGAESGNDINQQQRLGKQIKWVVLVDDDTILSVYRLARHLSCYNDPDTNDLYLGERYGFLLLDNEQSYNYITGGGGIVLSRPTLSKLANNCQCPSAASPDDMILAACLSQYGVVATHSSLFHQARPIDYPSTVIDSNTISFHKYWQIDPYDVYRRWFKVADDNLHRIMKQSNQLQHHQSEQHDDTYRTGGVNEFDCGGRAGGGDGGGGNDIRRKSGNCGNQIIRHSDYEMNHTDL